MSNHLSSDSSTLSAFSSMVQNDSPRNTSSASGSSAAFHPVVTKRACEAIYDQVRDLINKGDLKPGDRLPSERNMMEMFQRSRPTIREALRMLERSGYIRTIAGSNGAIVLEPNNKNVEQTVEDAIQAGHISLSEMNEYRRVSEAMTVRWAAERCTPEDAEKLRKFILEMEDSVSDYVRFVNMDPEFHALIAEAAHNQLCVIMNRTFGKIKQDFVRENMSKMTPADQLEMERRVLSMHIGIYEAIIAHDAELAAQRMLDHLDAYENDLI